MNKQVATQTTNADIKVLTMRQAVRADAPQIAKLLDQIGYTGTGPFLENRIYELNNRIGEYLIVAELNDYIIGLMSLHITPQLALPCDFAQIVNFSIDNDFRGVGVDTRMIKFAEKLAHEDGCTALEFLGNNIHPEDLRSLQENGFIEDSQNYRKMLRNRTFPYSDEV